MPLRTYLFSPVLFAMVLAPACAQRQMRAQAAVLAGAAAELERETAEFLAARTAMVKLRQRNLVERQQQIAEQGQYNARTLHYWRLARDPERDRQLALFDGLVAAAAAAAAVQDRTYEWEESVHGRAHALTIDQAALHRFVQQLVILSSPPRFIEAARFYAEYGAIVGKQVDDGLKEVQSSVGAVTAGGSSGGGAGGSSGGGAGGSSGGGAGGSSGGGSGGDGGTTPPVGPGTVTDPPRDPPDDPRPQLPKGPDDRTPPQQHRHPDPVGDGRTLGDHRP